MQAYHARAMNAHRADRAGMAMCRRPRLALIFPSLDPAFARSADCHANVNLVAKAEGFLLAVNTKRFKFRCINFSSQWYRLEPATLRASCEYWRTPHRLHRCAARFARTAARCPVRTGRKASRATALVVFRSRSSRTVIFRAGSCIRCTFPGRI